MQENLLGNLLEFDMNKHLIFFNNLITILIFIVVIKTSCPILKLKEK